jgi:hypothetical protein
MSVTQTVEVPASHRLTVDVPREIPTGPVILTFTPKAAPHEDTEGYMKAIEECSGLAKRLGINLSNDEFLEMRRQDKELEDRLDR